MIDITMSDDYRAFLEELNYKFTDSQTATLVWNDPMKSRQKKLETLALLRDTTKDIVLKKQLTERIEYENKLSKEEADIVNPFRPERFEDAFFEIPFCYKSAGTPVKDIVEHMEYFHLEKMTGMIIFKRLKTENGKLIIQIFRLWFYIQ